MELPSEPADSSYNEGNTEMETSVQNELLEVVNSDLTPAEENKDLVSFDVDQVSHEPDSGSEDAVVEDHATPSSTPVEENQILKNESYENSNGAITEDAVNGAITSDMTSEFEVSQSQNVGVDELISPDLSLDETKDKSESMDGGDTIIGLSDNVASEHGCKSETEPSNDVHVYETSFGDSDAQKKDVEQMGSSAFTTTEESPIEMEFTGEASIKIEPTNVEPHREKSTDRESEGEKPTEEKHDGNDRTEEDRNEEDRTEEDYTEEQRSEEDHTEEQRSEEQRTEEQRTEEQRPEEQRTEEDHAEEDCTEEEPTEEERTEEDRSEEKHKEEKHTQQECVESELVDPVADNHTNDDHTERNRSVEHHTEEVSTVEHCIEENRTDQELAEDLRSKVKLSEDLRTERECSDDRTEEKSTERDLTIRDRSEEDRQEENHTVESLTEEEHTDVKHTEEELVEEEVNHELPKNDRVVEAATTTYDVKADAQRADELLPVSQDSPSNTTQRALISTVDTASKSVQQAQSDNVDIDAENEHSGLEKADKLNSVLTTMSEAKKAFLEGTAPTQQFKPVVVKETEEVPIMEEHTSNLSAAEHEAAVNEESTQSRLVTHEVQPTTDTKEVEQLDNDKKGETLVPQKPDSTNKRRCAIL